MNFDIQLKISLRNHLLCGQLDELFQQINPLVEMLSEKNLCFDPKLDLKDEIIMTLKQILPSSQSECNQVKKYTHNTVRKA